MKVPDDIRKCVIFVGYLARDGVEVLGGTAFLIAEPIAGTKAFIHWVVTATHVINAIRASSVDGLVRLRVNTYSRGSAVVAVAVDLWASHETHDVAVASVHLDHEIMDYRLWPLVDENIASDQTIADEGIGVGDDLFFPGLFVHHPGTTSNIPIVRTGTIAAMPGEPLRLRYWGQMSAYLIEARSIGGLSGSPVFVHLGFVRRRDDQIQFSGGEHGRFLLLGVMSGHYETDHRVDLAEPSPSRRRIEDLGTIANEQERTVNMGIGIVVPIQRLIEIVNRPELDATKADLRQQHLDAEAGGAVEDVHVASRQTARRRE